MRSRKVFSKIIRNLQSLGVPYESIMDAEIYQEMTVAQDKIIAELYVSKLIQITLQTNVNSYPLSSSTGANKEKNINSIKAIKYPQGYDFIMKSNKDFFEIINENITIPSNTFICTVINNSLYLHPTPTATDNNKVLEVIGYENASAGVIDANNEPELPELFDKLLELYATSQLAPLEARRVYLEEFYQELKLLSNKFRRDYELYVKPVEGLW